MSHKLVSLYIGDGEYYTRTDADNVIAELKHQRDGAFGLTNLGLTLDDLTKMARKEIDRQKYKRCLAMAKLCQWKMGVFIYKKEKNEFYYRWYKRWLKIAVKFKLNKETKE